MISTKEKFKKIFTILLNVGVMMALVMALAPISAQAQGAPALFAEVANAAAYDVAPDPDFVSRSRLVRVNLDLIASGGKPANSGAGTEFTLNLFDDVNYTARIASTEANNFGYTWIGGVKEVAESDFFMLLTDGVFIAHVGSTDGIYEVSHVSGDVYQVIQIDQSKLVDHPPGEFPPTPADNLIDAAGDAEAATAGDSAKRIDVIVVYSNNALAGAGSLAAMKARIALAIAETNTGYKKAGVTTRVRLLHIEKVNYNDSGSMSTDLGRLAGTSDGFMDNVHGIRNRYAADMVTLVVENPGCGIAYLNSTKTTAFSVVKRSGCMTGYYSYGHELGHNQGAHHDKFVATNGTYPQGHGFVHLGANTYNRWRTVMSYVNACTNAGYSCVRVLRWSNKSKNYHGAATGNNTAQNYQVLNATDGTVANFRSQKIANNFKSSFNKNTNGWSKVQGKWVRKSGKYQSGGLKNKSASAKHSGTFGDLTCQARMKRTGGPATLANRFIIRGKPGSLVGSGWWKPSYVFQYANDGTFSVYEQKSNGTTGTLKVWTASNKINKGGWNTLKIVAVGKSLKLYINGGSPVWTGNDTTLKTGTVGLGFFRGASKGKLLVDWAKCSTTPTSILDVNESVAPGIELRGGTIDQSP